MSEITYRDLFGYRIGNNHFIFRDNHAENIYNSARDGKFGIELEDESDGLMLKYGGWYDNGTIVYDTNNTDWEGISYSFTPTCDYPKVFLEWLNTNEATGDLNISGTITDTNDDTSQISIESRGHFEVITDSNTGDVTDFVFLVDEGDEDGYIKEIHLNTDLTSITIYLDERKVSNFEGNVTFNVDNIIPIQWPIGLIPMGDIYDAIVDKLVADGYIQSQSQL